jgi:hypothetical protein
MVTGIQIRDELAPNQTRRWFTFNWSATEHVLSSYNTAWSSTS